MLFSMTNSWARFGTILLSAMLLGTFPALANADRSEPVSENMQHDGNTSDDVLHTAPGIIDQTPASPEDKMLTEKVTAALTGIQGIAVNTEHRVVTLMGTAASFDDKQKALSLTRNVDGVWTVKDEMEIRN